MVAPSQHGKAQKLILPSRANNLRWKSNYLSAVGDGRSNPLSFVLKPPRSGTDIHYG